MCIVLFFSPVLAWQGNKIYPAAIDNLRDGRLICDAIIDVFLGYVEVTGKLLSFVVGPLVMTCYSTERCCARKQQ